MREIFYFIASRESPPRGFLSSLTEPIDDPEVNVDIVDVELAAEINPPHSKLSVPYSRNRNKALSTASLESLNNRINQFSEKLKSLLLRDPLYFGPPVDTFLKNVEKYAKTDNQLVNGLIRSFRPVSLRKMRQLDVQPTAISRRKSEYKGKRSLIAGRPPKRKVYDPVNIVKKRTRNPRPHKLMQVVAQNKPPVPSMRRNPK